MPPAVLLINSLGTGGAERAVAAAAIELLKRGRDVQVLCLESAPDGAALPVPFPVGQLSRMKSSASGLAKLAALPLLAARLSRYAARHGVNVIMSHLFRANFVNVLARVIARSKHMAIVVNHTRMSRLSTEGVQGRINGVLSRWLYPKADLVASVSAGAAAESARLLRLPQNRSVTLNDPIDAAPAVDAAASGEKEADAPTIVCVGRLVALKRFQDVIGAFARVAREQPRLRLRIAGDGPERTALQRLCEKLGVAERVDFLGMVSEPSRFLTGCVFFVSASETEGFGMAIVEALAAGVPVIASDCAFGPREILAPSSDPNRFLEPGAGIEMAPYGILYPVGSVEALETAMRKILTDRDLRTGLSRKGPGRAADFSVTRAVGAYERLLFDKHLVIAYNTCWYVYNFRLPLIRALIGRGWRVTVLAPKDDYTERVIAAGAEHRHIQLDAKGTNPFRELATIQRFTAAYRALKPAVVLQYTIKPDIYGSMAARSLGIPVINTVTGLGTMFSGGLRELLARQLYRRAFSRADLVLFQNGDDRALFIEGRMVRPDHCGLLPGSGVDTERFSPRPRGSGPFTFLLAARLLKAKGVEDFIEAARKLKSRRAEAHFVLLGSHDPRDSEAADASLLRQAVEQGVVECPGHVDDIRPCIAASDCVVLPSYYREGVPRSLLEAASMGKPLIAADSVGTREPVRDGVNGLLCRPRDPDDLADKMEAMISLTPEKLLEMGEASRRYMMERFDEKRVIAVYLDAADRLAGTVRT